MILSAQTIRRLNIITPFHERTVAHGMTFGLGPAGYDLRIAEDHVIEPGGFLLASVMEHMTIPNDVLVSIHDKSTWARLGLALQCTIAEPGWQGILTLEITNHCAEKRRLVKGMPIAQAVFHKLDEPSDRPYRGKYQDQVAGPQKAILELGDDLVAAVRGAA